MTKLVLDHDPLTGVTEYMHVSNGGETVRIVKEQDPTSVLDLAQRLRNDDDFSRLQLKSDKAHYARIPWVVEQEMKLKHNVWWEDKNDHGHKKFFSVLNKYYPAFKLTKWNHE